MYIVCHVKWRHWLHDTVNHMRSSLDLLQVWEAFLHLYFEAPESVFAIITARNEVGARLCFYMCLWFCPQLVAAAETCTVGKRAVRILLECFLVFKMKFLVTILISDQHATNFWGLLSKKCPMNRRSTNIVVDSLHLLFQNIFVACKNYSDLQSILVPASPNSLEFSDLESLLSSFPISWSTTGWIFSTYLAFLFIPVDPLFFDLQIIQHMWKVLHLFLEVIDLGNQRQHPRLPLLRICLGCIPIDLQVKDIIYVILTRRSCKLFPMRYETYQGFLHWFPSRHGSFLFDLKSWFLVVNLIN